MDWQTIAHEPDDLPVVLAELVIRMQSSRWQIIGGALSRDIMGLMGHKSDSRRARVYRRVGPRRTGRGPAAFDRKEQTVAQRARASAPSG